jgi:hypothetical protein
VQLHELHESAFLAHCYASRSISRRRGRGLSGGIRVDATGAREADRPISLLQDMRNSHSGARGDLEAMGGAFYAVQVSLLDDLDPDELAAAPVRYVDGRHDRFDRAPDDVRLL